MRREAAGAGYTQARLAAEIGMHPYSLNLRWKGRRPWQVADLARVGAVLGVEPANFLRWASWDSNPQPTGYVLGWAGLRALSLAA